MITVCPFCKSHYDFSHKNWDIVVCVSCGNNIHKDIEEIVDAAFRRAMNIENDIEDSLEELS